MTGLDRARSLSLRAAGAASLCALALVACAAERDDSAPSGDRDGGVDLDQGARADGGASDLRDAPEAGPPDPAMLVRYVTKVVSFTPGACAGFGAEHMPDVVLGPPKGAGEIQGGTDVVSLGSGGEIVLSFEPSVIVDRPGVDFVVFENAFFANGDATKPFVELAEVSVSEDGETWTAFPCSAPASAPYGECAGWHPVYFSEAWDADELDPALSGGDPYDLATIGVAQARFVRIKDRTSQRCTSQGPNNNGFDLDAVGVVHGLDP